MRSTDEHLTRARGGLARIWGTVVAVLLTCSSPTSAEEVLETVTGTVQMLFGGPPGGAEELAKLGVFVGAPVALEFTVESTTPGQPDGDKTLYVDAIVGFELKIGDYVATLHPGDLGGNYVTVEDASLDSYVAAAFGTEPVPVLTTDAVPFVALSLSFFDADGSAMSNEGVVQDVQRFQFGSGAIGNHVNPTIGFTFDLGGGGGGPGAADPTALARQGQLKAASSFARKVLVAQAGSAQKPASADPLGAKLAAKVDNAEGAFGKQFLKAVQKAQKKGGFAPLAAADLPQASAGLLAAFTALADDVTDGLDSGDKHDRVLRAKLLRALAVQAGLDFAAQSKHAKKPSPGKLATKLATSRAVLLKKAGKALDVAGKKGVVYEGPSPEELADAVTSFVDEFVELTKG